MSEEPEPLADDLARLLAAERDGLPCCELVRRVHRRRGTVLAALRSDPRFEHRGRTHESRWRLRRTPWGGMGRKLLPWDGLDASGVPVVGRRAASAS